MACRKKHLKKRVTNFIKDLRIKVTIRHVSRIGQVANGKSILSKLYILKDMEKYKRISVTEDLTPKERKKVLELSKEATERNNSVMRLNWRVKGCSETGFFLKNIDNGRKHFI